MSHGALRCGAASEFDVFVARDRNLSYAQNLKALDLAGVRIHAISHAFANVVPLMVPLNEAVRSASVGAATIVSH